MDLPIDHFRLLGVSPTTDGETVLRTLQQRLDRAPDQGFTLDTLQARADLLQASADLLSDEDVRLTEVKTGSWAGFIWINMDDGCQPLEVIAATGPQTLRFGPMKPVGLRDPRTDRRPWAVVQLRQDNALGTLWNIVGFQTKLKHGEQTRIFRTIPGLEKAEFARLGGLHRNTFLNSPRLLDATLRLKAMPRLRFAGQITGCEGYVESAAVGLMTGRFAAAERLGTTQAPPPATTAMGALLGHITGGADAATFQPMNVNFGLFPPIDGTFKGKERKQAMSARALRDFDRWLAPAPLAAE